jgi:hypothetical protein
MNRRTSKERAPGSFCRLDAFLIASGTSGLFRTEPDMLFHCDEARRMIGSFRPSPRFGTLD